MKTTEKSNGKSERVQDPVNRSRTDAGKDQKYTGKEQKYEEEESALSKENSFGTGREFGMAVENKKKHEGESKSIHVEDWENDPYAKQEDEDDVRGELNVRGHAKERSERGNKTMDEQEGWRTHGGSDNTNTGQRNGNRESRKGTDETIGVP